MEPVDNPDKVSQSAVKYDKTYLEEDIYKDGGVIITPGTSNIRVYAFVPPFKSQAYIHIIPDDQVEFANGHFAKLYHRYESHNWTITEIKKKEERNEKTQLHPQTGESV
jgi:hypothetical protein